MNITHTKRAMLAAVAFVAAAHSAVADDEPAEPNCYVFVDRNGMETAFFGARIDLNLDAKNGKRMIVASAHTVDYHADFIWDSEDVKEIRREYRNFDAGLVLPMDAGERKPLVGYVDGTITAKSARVGAVLRVFNMAGDQVASQRLASEEAALNVAALPAGVYVVEVEGITIKITVQ